MICKKCGEFHLGVNKHICFPVYEVINEEADPEYIFEFRAIDEEAAAELWADKYDSQDGPDIANGAEAEVKVRRKGTEEWKTYIVSGEWTASYAARKADEL